jgi:N-acetylglucosamine-6-phosphate deacetylase
VIGEDLIARPPHGDHLVGSTVTMERSYRNLIDRVGMSEAEARKLLVENPRKAIGEEA